MKIQLMRHIPVIFQSYSGHIPVIFQSGRCKRPENVYPRTSVLRAALELGTCYLCISSRWDQHSLHSPSPTLATRSFAHYLSEIYISPLATRDDLISSIPNAPIYLTYLYFIPIQIIALPHNAAIQYEITERLALGNHSPFRGSPWVSAW